MTYINGRSVFATGLLFALLGIIAVVGRFVSRLRRRSGFGPDDWLCIPALLFTIGCSTVMMYGSKQKVIGFHTTIPTSEQEALYETSRALILEKLEIAFQTMSVAAIGCIKLVILFCYRRIFSGPVFVSINWTLIAIVIAWTLTFAIASLTACGRHIDYLWGSGSPEAEMTACVNTLDLNLLLAVTDFAIDLVLLVLPMPWVWRLQMRLKKKLAVTLAFLTGAFASAAGGVRMVLAVEQKIFAPPKGGIIFGLQGDIDQLGVISVMFFWLYIEVGVAMVACCLPPLRVLFENTSISSILTGTKSKGTPSLYQTSVFSSPTPTFKSRTLSAWSKVSFGSPVTPAREKFDDVELASNSSQRALVPSPFLRQDCIYVAKEVGVDVKGLGVD